MIRPMRPEEAPSVLALHRRCHPAWPAWPEAWWWAHPTLVALDEAGAVIGSTSFAVAFPPAVAAWQGHKEIAYGHGVSVDPDARGQGLGWQLAAARHAMLQELGIGFFVGMTWPGNAAMRAIFARQGLAQSGTVPEGYPWHRGADRQGLIYAGGVR